jgi:hypothetical protein
MFVIHGQWGRVGKVERNELKVFVIHGQWGRVEEVDPNKKLGKGTHHFNRAEPFAAQTETLYTFSASIETKRFGSTSKVAAVVAGCATRGGGL